MKLGRELLQIPGVFLSPGRIVLPATAVLSLPVLVIVQVERIVDFGCLALLLEVDGEDGVRAGGLVVHVGRGRRPVEGAVFQTLHRLILRVDSPRGHAGLERRGNGRVRKK